MNASNPNAGERDLEALRRAQRAHEPSMEEILASIRSIIADDREPAPPSRPPSRLLRRGAADRLFQGRAAAAPRRRNARAPRSRRRRRPSPAAPKVVWRQPESEPVAVAPVVRPEPAAGEEPLISLQTNQAVSAAFDALSASLALQSAELAENVTREILRPMLKAWLDEHLPSLVERLVRAEIQRVARGGR